MTESFITYSGVSKPESAGSTVYGRSHLSDFLDVWPHYGAAFGVDHIIYEDSTVELRVRGDLLEDLP